MRAATIQMNSGADVTANLKLADMLLRDASADGCNLAVLPENFALMPVRARDKADHAEQPGEGPIQAFLANAARRHGIWIVGGSMPLASPDPQRVYGGCPVVDDTGCVRALYRKIHLFDVDLPDTNESYRESHSMYPGDEPALVETPYGKVGLTICYDLRFPELFRVLVENGATMFTVPAAFTQTTGEAHWRVLLRSRAIENLAFVLAAGQTGVHPDERRTFGHSMIVDPWGRVLAELADGNGFVAADIDLDAQKKLRAELPVLDNRRL